MRILLVEDNIELADAITAKFRREGFNVDTFTRIDDAAEAMVQVDYGVVVLDIMLEDGSGLDLLTDLRRGGASTPVLMLTALDGIDDRIKGLDAGADDYLTKPFDTNELLARVRALMRRSAAPIVQHLQVGGLAIDVAGRSVLHDGGALALSRTEFLLLECLARNENRVCSKDVIGNAIYSFDDDWNDTAIEIHVHRLRKKLASVDRAPKIKSLRGLGYMLHLEKETA